ncbi:MULTISPECIES: hypothetical protein [unclassified Bacillus (in: firmicutes)]|uniref:hypothetical protein n=1 Tax=unclassified Bacillus (in: firmicutes) TaxID=185979 RepID=UPI000BF4CB6C|nr:MULTISPECIES: hypothetical protein [unclassified Bacillus (in: firmicutes)]
MVLQLTRQLKKGLVGSMLANFLYYLFNLFTGIIMYLKISHIQQREFQWVTSFQQKLWENITHAVNKSILSILIHVVVMMTLIQIVVMMAIGMTRESLN